MRSRAFAAFILAFCLVPHAAAELVPLAQLHATSLRASGLAEAVGDARALLYRSNENADVPRFSLQLQAGHLHIEVDHAQGVAQPPAAEVYAVQWTDKRDYDNASARLESARAHVKVELLEIPGRPMSVTSSASCLDLALPHEAQVQATKFTQSSRDILRASTDGALEVLPCRGLAQVQGDFLLVLWEATIAVASPAGQDVHHSGMGKAPARGTRGQLGPAEVDQSDQIYAIVTNGRLQLQLAPDSDGTLTAYLVEPALRIHGQLDASNAKGTLLLNSGKTEELPAQVQLQGDLAVALGRAPDGMAAQVRGQPESLKVNGALALQTLTPTTVSQTTWLLSIPLLAGAGLVTALLRRRHRFDKVPLRVRIAGRFAKPEPQTPRLVLRLALCSQLWFNDGHTNALRASIHFTLGNYEDSLKWADRANATLADPPCIGANGLAASQAASRLDRHDEAGRWFAIATQADPSVGTALKRDARLRHSWSQPGFQDWLRGASPTDDLLQP